MVSIVMPAYNVANYIEKAINSVCVQTFLDWGIDRRQRCFDR